MFDYKYHIFCCQNQREPDNPRGSCRNRGSRAILDFFKKIVREQGLKKEVRVTRSGCLGACIHGPSVVIYPEGTWYTVATVADAEEIFRRHVIGGEPVKELFMRDQNRKFTA